MAFRLDRAQLQPPRRRADGSVVYDGKLTRSGVLEYRQPDGSIRREYRPPAEVGNADSLASLKLVHVCDDHPAKRGEAKNKSVGAVGDSIAFDGKFVNASVMVREDAVNAKVAHGKSELSCGYDTVLVEIPGVTPEGERYDAIQTQIRYEHVAIVDRGRAGPDVRLRLDALEPEPDERDDAALRVSRGSRAGVTVTSTSLSAVDLEKAVNDAVAKMPGCFVEPERIYDRADGVTVESRPYQAPSVWVGSRDLSLDDLTSQLAEALGPGVSVKRGDAATTLRQDTAAMDLAAALAKIAELTASHAAEKARADAADAKVKDLEGKHAAEKARADAADEKAAAAEKARQDAVDAAPALVRARVELEHKVKPILGETYSFKVDGKDKTDHTLRLDTLDKLGAKVGDQDRKDETYVKVRFDIALEQRAAAGANVDAARPAGGTRVDAGGVQPPMTEREAMAEAKKRADARSQTPAPARA